MGGEDAASQDLGALLGCDGRKEAQEKPSRAGSDQRLAISGGPNQVHVQAVAHPGPYGRRTRPTYPEKRALQALEVGRGTP